MELPYHTTDYRRSDIELRNVPVKTGRVSLTHLGYRDQLLLCISEVKTGIPRMDVRSELVRVQGMTQSE